MLIWVSGTKERDGKSWEGFWEKVLQFLIYSLQPSEGSGMTDIPRGKIRYLKSLLTVSFESQLTLGMLHGLFIGTFDHGCQGYSIGLIQANFE